MRCVTLAQQNAQLLHVARDMDSPVRAQGSREDPHQREVPDIGIALGMHHLGHERTIRVRRHGHWLATLHGGHRGQRVQPGVREGGFDHVQEDLDAGAILGRDRQHRVEGPVRDRLE